MKLHFLTLPSGNPHFKKGALLLQPNTGKWEVATHDKSNNYPFVPHLLLLIDKGKIQPQETIYHPQYGIGRSWLQEDKLLVSYDGLGYYNRAADSVTLHDTFPNQVRVLATNMGLKGVAKIPDGLLLHFAQNEPKEVEVTWRETSGPPEILEWK
jgi:hypothetical protein